MKISIIGQTGNGKTTTAKIIENHFKANIIKLAEPLYDIQKEIYDKLGITLKGQDGELLQFLGDKIQRLSPEFLVKEFFKKCENIEFIVNDDCRPHNYKYLKDKGFIFFFIDGIQRERKEDHTSVDKNHKVEWNDKEARLKSDYILENKGSIEELEKKIIKLINSLLHN